MMLCPRSMAQEFPCRSFPCSAWECLNGRSAFGSGRDAERPGLHSHAERGNDHRCFALGAWLKNSHVDRSHAPRGNASTDAPRSAPEGTQSVPGCVPTQSVGTIFEL